MADSSRAPDAPGDPDAPDPTERLARALAAMRQWVAGDESASAFLARHEDLRAELEPMLLGTGPTPNTLSGDRLLAGRFHLLRLIGRGGMGSVYEAFDERLRRVVAVKLLRAVLLGDDQAKERFCREAELMARVQHPDIVAVHEIGEIDGSPFLVMDLVEGRPLSHLIATLVADAGAEPAEASRRLAALVAPPDADQPTKASPARSYEEQVVDWIIAIAMALDHAHDRGLVHRDVKPSNILITRQGRAMLTDFGLAREQGVRGLTLTGEFAGTPDYASPEHFGAPTALDARSDVFSLGATAYELLTLRRPFHADSELEIRERVVRHEPRAANALNPRVPRDLAAVIARALEKSPARRYASAAAFADDLQRWRAGYPVSARPAGLPLRLRRWVVRNPLPSAFLALLSLSTVSVSLLAWRYARLLSQRDVDDTAIHADDAWDRAPRLAAEARGRAPALTALRQEVVELCGRRDEFRARLSYLRRGGERVDPGTRPAAHPRLRAELSEQRGRRDLLAARARDYDRGEMGELLHSELAASDIRVASLEAALIDTRGWLVDRQAEYDAVADLVWRLDELATRQLPRIDACLARSTGHLDPDLEARWRSADAALARDARFAGVPLARHSDLAPLGPDPDSGLWEFALLDSGAAPVRDRQSGRLDMRRESGLVMVLLPGRTTGDDPFLCSKFELSVAQMQRLVSALPLTADGTDAWLLRDVTSPTVPAADVSWDESVAILGAFDLALPTAREWIWACRGDHDQVTWWTQDFPQPATGGPESAAQVERLLQVANVGRRRGNFLWPIDKVRVVEPPGYEPAVANRHGLVHMHGNVGEWLADLAATPVDESGLEFIAGRARWVAGGSVMDEPTDSLQPIGCGRFERNDRRFRSTQVGLRPVRPWRR